MRKIKQTIKVDPETCASVLVLIKQDAPVETRRLPEVGDWYCAPEEVKTSRSVILCRHCMGTGRDLSSSTGKMVMCGKAWLTRILSAIGVYKSRAAEQE